MKQIEIVQTRKEESEKLKPIRSIDKQMESIRRALIQARTPEDAKHWENALLYWQTKKTEAQAVYEVILQDQNEIIADFSDVEIVTEAETQSKTFLEEVEAEYAEYGENGIVDGFISERAYYKYDETKPKGQRDITYSNEEIEANIKALALEIRKLPLDQYLEAMHSIHRSIER